MPEDEKKTRREDNPPVGDKGKPDSVPAENKQDKKSADFEEMKEKMLRIAAEYDNYKKRSQTEILKSWSHGKIEVMKQILPVLDEFEFALIAMQVKKERAEGNVVLKGIEMVYTNLIDSLKRSGLTEIRTDGAFDPMNHEAVMTKEDGSEYGFIIEVVKKGYTLDGILVRPASVIISSGKAENITEENSKNKEDKENKGGIEDKEDIEDKEKKEKKE